MVVIAPVDQCPVRVDLNRIVETEVSARHVPVVGSPVRGEIVEVDGVVEELPDLLGRESSAVSKDCSDESVQYVVLDGKFSNTRHLHENIVANHECTHGRHCHACFER